MRRIATLLLLILSFDAPPWPAFAGQSPGFRDERLESPAGPFDLSPQEARSRSEVSNQVFKARLTPHWLNNNTRFWYRNDLRGGAKEFILVDAEKGGRSPAFDHARLARSLTTSSGIDCLADHLPFDSIDFQDGNATCVFTVGDAQWRCDLKSYDCSKVGLAPGSPPGGDRQPGSPAVNSDDEPESIREVLSPDGNWMALVKEHNLWLRSRLGGEESQLSSDGREGLEYRAPSWSPDSKSLVAFQVEPGDRNEVYLIESSPKEGGRARLHSRPYSLPGDKFPKYEVNLFDLTARTQVKPKVDRFEHEWLAPRLHWSQDQRHFTYSQMDRGHQRFRVIQIDSHTGEVHTVIEETTPTFIWSAHTESVRMQFVHWLEKSDEMIYASERDGWRHLYLVDVTANKITNRITGGEWVIRGIDGIDEDSRQIWFSASGRNSGQDPYFLHWYRVGFDGTGLVALTEANGNHSVQFSPDRRYLIDTWSRVDSPPAHELRRSSDGKLVCELERADNSDLVASGWQPPEIFVAKGRDGKTDIWGIICRPNHIDPQIKYAVIEDIYAGPQDSYVPKTFSATRRYASLTDLGFIVVKIDGMGTANRSKAFHDVCWHDLKDAGLPDRILWHQAVAAKYSYYDTNRVGVYGNSAGGQNAAAAVLFHPEFYKAAVASCGCHDNRMDKASWNEQWMGYPVGPQYAESSNIENAGRLRGKLFLIVGEMDNNVPPESTLRFADALIKAKKDFDLLVVPGGGHGMGGEYGQRRMRDFFTRTLLMQQPPDRNVPDEPTSH